MNLIQKALDSVLQVGDISTVQVIVLKAGRAAGVERATAGEQRSQVHALGGNTVHAETYR